MSPPDSCNLPSDIWRQWAADLAAELDTPVTWTPFGFLVRGEHVAAPEAVPAIARRP